MSEISVIGVDLGGTNVSAGRISGTRITESVTREIEAHSTTTVIIDQILTAIETVHGKSAAGIGVGVPSLVDLDNGVVFDVQNIPSWKKVPLKGIIEEHFDLPVYINNDANCFAVGERYFGKGRQYSNMVGITLGTGIGAGIIINGRLYSGSNCGAGEFGSLPYRDGTLEDFCSSKFFGQCYNTTGSDLYMKAAQGTEEALRIFEEYGSHVGEAVKSILYAVDPEAVIFGGSISRSFEYFISGLREKLKSFPYKRTVENLVLDKTGNHNSALLGAAALYLEATHQD